MESLNDSLNEYRKIKPSSKAVQSIDKYLHRLKTYQLQKWFAKPAEFSPIECARRGWFNLNKDTLKCEICSNILYHHSQSPLNTVNMAKISSLKYDEKCITSPKSLTEKHDNFCPWRAYKIPDRYIIIDIYDEEKLVKNFNNRFLTYSKCPLLPRLDENIFQLINKSNIDMSDIPLEYKEPFEIKYILSCCGWTYNEQKDILNCEQCLRVVGLWLYERVNNHQESFNSKSNESNEELQHNRINDDSNLLSEQLIIKNLINKIVNLISINEENRLNKSNMEDIVPRFKRKSDFSLENSLISNSKKGNKFFNPINQHQSWCPWLFESNSLVGKKTVEEKYKKVYKSMCIMSFEKLSKIKRSIGQNENKELNKKTIECSNNESLMSRIKNIQSILVNSSSQLSQF